MDRWTWPCTDASLRRLHNGSYRDLRQRWLSFIQSRKPFRHSSGRLDITASEHLRSGGSVSSDALDLARTMESTREGWLGEVWKHRRIEGAKLQRIDVTALIGAEGLLKFRSLTSALSITSLYLKELSSGAARSPIS